MRAEEDVAEGGDEVEDVDAVEDEDMDGGEVDGVEDDEGVINLL